MMSTAALVGWHLLTEVLGERGEMDAAYMQDTAWEGR